MFEATIAGSLPKPAWLAEPNKLWAPWALSGQALYYHHVGTPQSQDTLVYERKDLPSWIINGDVTEDGRYLMIVMFEGAENKNRLYYADLGSGKACALDILHGLSHVRHELRQFRPEFRHGIGNCAYEL